MIKKIISTLIIIAFVINFIFTIPVDKTQARLYYSGNILYVGGSGPGNYTVIQDAIDDANPGDTVFVYNGTYIENIVVDKTIDLIGEDKNNTKIDGNDNDYTIQISDNWVNISGFNIVNAHTAGIRISSEYNTIENNNISSNLQRGIVLRKSNNTIIFNIFSNNRIGVGCSEGPGSDVVNNLFVSNNIFISSKWGVFLLDYNSIICNNTFINDGIYRWTIHRNNVFNNTVNGKPLLVLKNEHDIIVEDAGQIFLLNCTNVTIQYQNLSNTTSGIFLVNSNNCSIKNNDFYNNYYGIGLYYSNINYIIDNNMAKCDYGLELWHSHNNKIIRNCINDNVYGVLFFDGQYNYFVNNNFLDNEFALYSEYKLKNNLFFHNNFINNVDNFCGEKNNWDNGYPSGGNYWDDYVGYDNFSGSNQDIPGSDGIGDIPYQINGYNQWDNYPLMNLYIPPDTVYVDDDFNTSTLGWGYDHFNKIKDGVDAVDIGGTICVYNGFYNEIDDLIIYKENILLKGMNPPGKNNKDESAIINFKIKVQADGITITNFSINPNLGTPALLIENYVDASTITIQYNKFQRENKSNAIGIENNGSQGVLDARFNWWGAFDGPSGQVIDADTGRIADGYGVKIIDNGPVLFDSWAGIDASAESSAIIVEIGVPLVFNGEDSFAYHFDGTENSIVEYFWDFDDGFYSFEKQIAHVFDTPGTYDVSLRIKAYDIELYGGFMYDWDYLTIIVTTPDAPLSANADGNNLGGYETKVDNSIQLFGLAIGGTEPYIYKWYIGDSTTVYEQNPIHIFEEPGTYTATLIVTDKVGDQATDTAEITVHDFDELVASINAEPNGIVDISMFFNSIVSGGKEPYIYKWDFGDGIISEEANPSHIFENAGTYTVTLTVIDDKGQTDTDTIIVDIQKDIKPAEIMDVIGGFGIKANIVAGDLDCDWKINVNGRFVLLGGEATGTIPSGKQETVKLPFTFALGKADIVVTANEIKKDYTAFALGPFFLKFVEN